MEKSRIDGLKGLVFPLAAGWAGGLAAVAVGMLASACIAPAVGLPLSGFHLLVWLPAVFGGFAAGGFAAGFAPEWKLPCGAASALLLWAVVLLLQREYGASELARGGAILLVGLAGAAAFSGGRRKFKPGKGRPGMRRARRRKGPF